MVPGWRDMSRLRGYLLAGWLQARYQPLFPDQGPLFRASLPNESWQPSYKAGTPIFILLAKRDI